MSNQRFVTFASVISEIEQSDVFMTVRARILETPKANLNGCRVTEAFIDDIISNKERYVGLPLYADKKALTSGKYNRLGHLYDSKTGEFHSAQIGSFYDFEKEDFEGGSYLVGYARIPKRDKALSKAIAELFAEGRLKFSFEIACGDYTELDDGTIEIDASENNYLEGTAIVTFPACEDAVALEFVAQHEPDERGDEDMAEETKVVAEEEVETPVEAAEATPQTVDEAVENAACNEKKDEKASEEKAEETAAVYVTEHHTEELCTSMYDTETGKEAYQSIEVRTSVTDKVEGNLVETDDGVHVVEAAEAEPAENTTETQIEAEAEAPVEAPAEEPSAEPETEVNEEPEVAAESEPVEEAGQPVDEHKAFAEMIAELTATVKALTEEVKDLKEKKVVASAKKITAENVNPFIDDMSANGNKYSLLEHDTPVSNYSLLSK